MDFPIDDVISESVQQELAEIADGSLQACAVLEEMVLASSTYDRDPVYVIQQVRNLHLGPDALVLLYEACDEGGDGMMKLLLAYDHGFVYSTTIAAIVEDAAFAHRECSKAIATVNALANGMQERAELEY